MTSGIYNLGGVELYLKEKCLWLKAHGYEVHIFSYLFSKDEYLVKELNEYRNENLHQLAYTPYECGSFNSTFIIHKIKSIIGSNRNYEKTIIESHSGNMAMWGELLAKKTNGKHIFYALHEEFGDSSYFKKRDFFIFKIKQGDLYCGKHAEDLLVRNILNIKDINPKTIRIFYNPISDIDDDRLKDLKRHDYNICYIGRTSKAYFPSILKGIEGFSKKHKESSVQCIVVGEIGTFADTINRMANSNKNLSFYTPGNMFPISKKLFEFCDVVCASAGSARAAVYEGVPVVIPDIDNYMANGIYGYDTMQSVAKDPNVEQVSILSALENVLIKKTYKSFPFRLTKQPTPDECYLPFINEIEAGFYKKQYYPKRKILFAKTFSIKIRIKVFFMNSFSNMYSKYYLKKYNKVKK